MIVNELCVVVGRGTPVRPSWARHVDCRLLIAIAVIVAVVDKEKDFHVA